MNKFKFASRGLCQKIGIPLSAIAMASLSGCATTYGGEEGFRNALETANENITTYASGKNQDAESCLVEQTVLLLRAASDPSGMETLMQVRRNTKGLGCAANPDFIPAIQKDFAAGARINNYSTNEYLNVGFLVELPKGDNQQVRARICGMRWPREQGPSCN